MTSADQPYVPAIPGPKASDDPSFMRDTNAPEENAQDDLANFAALADPDTIAGAPIQNKVERENSDLVGRLRAELQRRAKQVESLSHDLSSTQTAKTDTQKSESNYWIEGASGEGEADLLSALRSHFIFEDFTAFGHLVDRFISPEIGPNFDPEDDRDRRFIEQIANLDEAKLDAGALDPLHILARLSAR